ncbi:MAG: radical SAM protein [Thermoguttaceae bacterium]|jgi:MoaA/NifB/PqqE/SkfB family radical SAM enzyme
MSFVANYIRNLGRVWTGRQPIRPLLFSYYVTHRCELGCRYCCDGDGKRFKEDPVPELDTADARRLLSVLRPAGDTLDVTGGEPLVREDLEEILAHAHSIGFRTVLNTKGIGLVRRGDLLRYTGVLVLSLDTLEPSCLAKVIGRPRDVAEEILATLDYALTACRRTDTKLVLAAVATPDNLAEVGQVLQFAMGRGLGFQLSPEIVGTSVNPALRANEVYRQLIDRTLAMKRSHRGILGVPAYLLGIRDFRAFRCLPLLMPVIRPDGRMYYPCLERKQAEINLLEAGNYFEALRAARRRFGEIPACRDCCHIFCHMALSLLQSHPLSALRELEHWRHE